MTHKIQYSKKFDDGGIIVVGGDSIEEFEANYTAVKNSEVVRHLLKPQNGTQAQPSQMQTVEPPPPNQGGAEEVHWATLPGDAVLEIAWKGDKYHGEISPFPGTKYPVWVWPEVLEQAQWFSEDQRSFDVGGLMVGFVKNEKGYPQKVTLWGK